MKKIAMLLAAAAVVASANAGSPAGAANMPKQQYRFGDTAKMVSDFGTNIKAGVTPMAAGKMKKADEAEPLTAKYSLPTGTMSIGLSEENSYSSGTYRLNAAYAPMTYANKSTGAAEYEWEYWGPNYTAEDPDYQYADTQDLTVSYPGFTYVKAPTLYVSNEAGEDASYSDNYEYTYYKFGGNNHVYFNDGSDAEMGCMTDMYTLRIMAEDLMNEVPEEDEHAGFYYWPQYGYYPSYDSNNSTTGIEQQLQDWIYSEYLGEKTPTSTLEFAGFGAKFPQPSGVYSITKLWIRFYMTPKKNTNVECTLYKLDEDGNKTDEVLARGMTTITKSLPPIGKMLVFELSSVDEDGLETDDPVLIDCPFIAELEFNIADFAMLCPVAGDGCLVTDRNDAPPVNNTILVKINGELESIDNPWVFILNDGSGYNYINDWCCMIDAEYTFMADASGSLTKTVPAEGGEVVYDIDSFYNLAYFFQEGLVMTNAPEDIEITGYENNEETGNQVMTIAVTPLPEGETYREIYLEFDPAVMVGCPNLLTIQQGDNGVNVVATDCNAKYFDLAGRQVANPEKGLYIKVNGNKAEKVIF